MAYVNINYDFNDFAPTLQGKIVYENISISFKSRENMIFNSGNFVKDWFNMKKWLVFNLPEDEAFVTYSSDVDNFIMDGAPYDSVYLIDYNNGGTLIYTHPKDDHYTEFFVPEGTKPTWKELKKMCE